MRTNRRPIYRPENEIQPSKNISNSLDAAYSETSPERPIWNTNARPFSINKSFNPEIQNPNEKRFKWDHELKKRGLEQGRIVTKIKIKGKT